MGDKGDLCSLPRCIELRFELTPLGLGLLSRLVEGGSKFSGRFLAVVFSTSNFRTSNASLPNLKNEKKYCLLLVSNPVRSQT